MKHLDVTRIDDLDRIRRMSKCSIRTSQRCRREVEIFKLSASASDSKIRMAIPTAAISVSLFTVYFCFVAIAVESITALEKHENRQTAGTEQSRVSSNLGLVAALRKKERRRFSGASASKLAQVEQLLLVIGRDRPRP